MKYLALLVVLALGCVAWIWMREAAVPALASTPSGNGSSEVLDDSVVVPRTQIADGIRDESTTHVPGERQALASIDATKRALMSGDAVVFVGTLREAAYPHSPIEKARVQLLIRSQPGEWPVQVAERTTAEDGHFRFNLGNFPDLSPEELQLMQASVWAWRDGYRPMSVNAPTPGLVRGETEVEIELRTGLTIQGRVLKPSGLPAVGASVRLSVASGSYSGGRRTDGQGRFVMQAGRDEIDLIEAHLGGFARASLPLAGRDLVADPNVGNLQLTLGGTITGRVACKEGSPMSGVPVEAWAIGYGEEYEWAQSKALAIALTDEVGDFVLSGLPGERVVLVVERKNCGTYDVGEAAVDLTYPGKRLVLRVVDQEGVLGEVARVFLGAGSLSDGEVSFNLTASIMPDGSVSTYVGNNAAVSLQVFTPEDVLVERVVFPPTGQCSWEEVIVLPSDPPLGSIELDLRKPSGESIETAMRIYRWSSTGARMHRFSGQGPHVLGEGGYIAHLSPIDASEEHLLPITIGNLEVEAGRVTRIERTFEVGARLSLTISSDAVPDGEHPTASVYLEGNGGLEPLHFFEGMQTRLTGLLPLDCTSLVDTVLPVGTATLTIRMKGYQTAREAITLVRGETLEHSVILLPLDE